MALQTRLKVVGMDHIVLHVRNMESSRRFYIDLLGMPVEQETPFGPFLKCGPNLVVLFEAKADAEVEMGLVTIPTADKIQGGAEFNHLALRLESGEYEDVKAALEASGIEVHHRPADEHCIYIADPDGHRLQLLVPNEPR